MVEGDNKIKVKTTFSTIIFQHIERIKKKTKQKKIWKMIMKTVIIFVRCKNVQIIKYDILRYARI